MHDAAPSDTGRRGAALFIVLMLAAVLSSLAAVAMRSSTSGAHAAALFADVLQADELGRETADLVAYYVAIGGPERRRGGSFLVRLAKADIAVRYVSESARIDANQAPLELIDAVLAAAGAEPSEIGYLNTQIAHFRAQTSTPDASGEPANSGAGAQNASTPPPPAAGGTPQPENGAEAQSAEARVPLIQSTNEIAEAWHLPFELARRILPTLTVASRSGKVDPVLADRLVLQALFGGDSERIDDYLKQRSRGFSSADSALASLPSPSRALVSFTDAPALRAVSQVKVAGRFERRYEVVLQLPKQVGQLPDVLSWQPLM